MYDNTFSLRTGDISPDGNAQYVIAEYVDKVGYVVRTVTRDNVLIPERAVVLAFFGKESSFASTGNILALTRADNLAPPISETSLKLYVYDHKAVFGIDSQYLTAPTVTRSKQVKTKHCCFSNPLQTTMASTE